MNDFNVKSDQAPEGAGKGPNDNPAADVSFTNLPQNASDPVSDGAPFGDALPLDGSLSMHDTEILDQTNLHPDENRVLLGSEAGQTANARIDSSDATDRAVDSKGNFGKVGDDATSSDADLTQALGHVKGDEKPGQTATGGQ